MLVCGCIIDVFGTGLFSYFAGRVGRSWQESFRTQLCFDLGTQDRLRKGPEDEKHGRPSYVGTFGVTAMVISATRGCPSCSRIVKRGMQNTESARCAAGVVLVGGRGVFLTEC